MKLRNSWIKLRRYISFQLLTVKYWMQGSTVEEAEHIAKGVVYGWNWGKDEE